MFMSRQPVLESCLLQRLHVRTRYRMLSRFTSPPAQLQVLPSVTRCWGARVYSCLGPRRSFAPPPSSPLTPFLPARSISSRVKYPTLTMLSPPRSPCPKSKVLVLGSGNFGSCLADHLGDSEHQVYLWSRKQEFVDYFNAHHRNPDYLKDHEFSGNIHAVGPDIPDADFIKDMDVILFAIPTQALRENLIKLRPNLILDRQPLLIFVNKGIETDTQALTLEIIADTCGPEIATRATFISGPSFAKEIVRRQPTSVSVASLDESQAQRATEIFHQPWFRCYTGGDPIGLELAGALKNVYAIAAGMADGLGFESNTRAAIITRGLAEMTRIGTAYGASPLTFLGLAGVGDLFMTCSSPTSRNYTVGYRLGKGEKLEDIIATLGSVAEGVTTAKGLKKIIDELGVEAAIATGIYEVLYEGKAVNDNVHELMARPPSRELDLPQTSGGGHAGRLLAKLGRQT
ncbi:glycerol-3-phosphate dehydrogenase [Coniophora puteana RWD-64-598 SS2]|uniref:Glycerol-3-phosphate dehydrogenase [NAD(+)] n=1 Tax=Coniophora puteana (strain RWD-64-598) TaxID=741705 RepID=A0A5M3N6P9_CONPW|nr:glycerol-3-phosphate dehydrogenase [Coniophora puteana RWD-64-598 SS2]EIW86907.1 glycerol-3-phosphate dehydrogenase [Coniophora puteana RWD-64-598 SS2]